MVSCIERKANEEELTGVPLVEHFAMGFPRLASMQRSDDDLLMFRSFHQTQIRILLYMQVEITRMEEKLQAMDKEDEVNIEMKYRLKCTEQKQGHVDKDELFQKLKTTMTEYRKVITNKSHEMRANLRG